MTARITLLWWPAANQLPEVVARMEIEAPRDGETLAVDTPRGPAVLQWDRAIGVLVTNVRYLVVRGESGGPPTPWGLCAFELRRLGIEVLRSSSADSLLERAAAEILSVASTCATREVAWCAEWLRHAIALDERRIAGQPERAATAAAYRQALSICEESLRSWPWCERSAQVIYVTSQIAAE